MPESSPEDGVVNEADKVEGAAPENADVKVTSAESSPAEPKGEKGTLLDAVKAALKPPTEKAPDSKTEGSEPDKAAKPEEGKEAESDEHTEEELARLRPKTRKRIENLVAARRELEGHLAEIQPKAQQFDKMVRYIDNAGLSTEEVNDGFDVMRLLKHEPLKAWERLKPIFDQLRSMVGEVLPDDLQGAVNEGKITEAHAKELALTRTRAAVSTAQLERKNTEEQETATRNVHQERQTRVSETIAGWEKSKGSDPDWKLKQPRVMEKVELETARRERRDPSFVWTPEEALKFADEALRQVTDELKQFAPKPRAMNPITDVASTRSEAKPVTLLEAAKQGLARMAG